MTSYIVRIYRRGSRPEEITGTVEMPEHEGRTPFNSFRELAAILLQDGRRKAPALKRAGSEEGGR